MSVMSKCVCDGCICIAICRHKTFKLLIHDCAFISKKYITPEQWLDVQDALDPTTWRLNEKGYLRWMDAEKKGTTRM